MPRGLSDRAQRPACALVRRPDGSEIGYFCKSAQGGAPLQGQPAAAGGSGSGGQLSAACPRPPSLPAADPVTYYKHREAKVAEEFLKVAEAKVRAAPLRHPSSLALGSAWPFFCPVLLLVLEAHAAARF